MKLPPLPGDPSVLPPTQEFKPVCSVYSAIQLLCSLPAPGGTFCPVVTKTLAAALVFPVGQGTPCRANKPCAWGERMVPRHILAVSGLSGCIPQWQCVCVHLRTLGFLSNKISDCCKLSLGDGLARQSRGLVVVPDLLRALLQKAQGTVMVIRTVVCRGKKALKQLKQRTQSQQDRNRKGRRQHLTRRCS